MQEVAEQMMQTTVPAEHQALGRKAKGFSRVKWDERELLNWWESVPCNGDADNGDQTRVRSWKRATGISLRHARANRSSRNGFLRLGIENLSR